jgi:DNA polymerase-3 subunit alpha
MKDFIRQLKPSCFEDLIAVLSLFRPAPIYSGMVDDFIKRKHGHGKIVYELPQLEPILKNTYGVMIYHEQVLEIMQAIAGYSLGEADLLRRKFVKLSIPAHAIEKEQFLAGAQKQGISARTATSIFYRTAKYAEFCFLKAHATAYAMIGYQSAYLKAHYPEEFKKAFRSHRKLVVDIGP